jgi:hypothetical protein
MKYMIHNSERYYPGSYEYDTLQEAVDAFEKLKAERRERAECNYQPGDDLYFDKDYLCIVIDEIDAKKISMEVKPCRE